MGTQFQKTLIFENNCFGLQMVLVLEFILSIYIMGNFQNNYEEQSKQWQTISLQNKNLPGRPTLSRSTKTKLITEQFIIDIPVETSERQQLRLYDKRQSSMSGHLVNVIAAYPLQKSLICSPYNQLFDVKVQYIPWRFSNINYLTTNQVLYFLKGIFSACQELMIHVRTFFHLTQHMIGLNCRGITKIWLNSNFAVNSFEKTEDERGEKFSEKEMVIKIIQMVTKKCPNIDQNINFELKSCWKSDFTTKLMIIHKYMNQRQEDQIKDNLLKRLISQKPANNDKIEGKKSCIFIKNESKASIAQLKQEPSLKFKQNQRRQQNAPLTNLVNLASERKKVFLQENIPRNKMQTLKNPIKKVKSQKEILFQGNQGKPTTNVKKINEDYYRPRSSLPDCGIEKKKSFWK